MSSKSTTRYSRYIVILTHLNLISFLSGEMPVYQNIQENTENEKQHIFFKELQSGEEAEYTLIYVIDKDQVQDAYLQFFEGAGLVKVEK